MNPKEVGKLLSGFYDNKYKGLSDEELKSCINCTEYVLQYLEGRGDYWSLAIMPLISNLEELYQISNKRQQRKKING